MFVHPKDRLATDNPKCANCVWWGKHAGAIGECGHHANLVYTNEATARNVKQYVWTTDLMLCSNWVGRGPVEIVEEAAS